LVDAEGEVVAQSDTTRLTENLTTEDLLPGFPAGTSRSIPLPADLPTGTYRVLMGAYEPGSVTRIPAFELDQRLEDDIITLGHITVTQGTSS